MIGSENDPRYENGVPLDLYPDDLHHVPEEHDLHPAGTFDQIERAGPMVREYIDVFHDPSFSFMQVAHALPMQAYEDLTVCERQMIRLSTDSMFSSGDVRTMLEEDPRHEIMYKITNSMHKWGRLSRPGWNEHVDAYKGIRSFDLGVPGFDVLLDRTCWFHGRGISKYAEVFLDGSFGFNVMHQGRRVMTIGFSIGTGHTVLINQIQLASRRGNRWMFRFPANRVETILDAFRKAFPLHSIRLVDGSDASRRILDEYHRGIAEGEAHLVACTEGVARGSIIWKQKDIDEAVARLTELRDRLAHLQGDAPRLKAFYEDAGRHRLGEPVTANGLAHREVLPLAA